MPDEQLYRDFISGYGVGARILYSRQKAGADPLGEENILGFITGPLTGTPAITGARYTALAKSPLTGTWGNANSGGDFGPYLKFSGYDSIFFTGISQKPVYLLIDHGKAELRDASHLWRRDTFETEDILISELGEDVHVACSSGLFIFGEESKLSKEKEVIYLYPERGTEPIVSYIGLPPPSLAGHVIDGQSLIEVVLFPLQEN